MNVRPLILVDMDGVLADFDRRFIEVWESRYPDRPTLDQTRRTNYRIVNEFKEEYHKDVFDIFEDPGFYLSLSAMPGAIAAMYAMEKAGYDVWICSTPQIHYRHCVTEKYQWVQRELGEQWIERMILTRKKAMVRGDILIDDQPVLPDAASATWCQLLFDAPYNQGPTHLSRVNWHNWEHVLNVVLADTGCVRRIDKDVKSPTA